MSAPTIAFKAGRLARRGDTNWVDPLPEKGVVLITSSEEGLLQWQWKSRTSGVVEEDLLIFPTDTTFSRVTQSAWGRTFVLSFASSDQKHFYWLQDASSARDEQIVTNVNGILSDPSYTPSWAADPSPSSVGSAFANANDTLRRLREILTSGGSHGGSLSVPPPSLALSDVLTPVNLTPIFENEQLVRSLFPYLPSDLPIPPSTEVLQQVISSTQFQSAVRELDRALSTGLLGDLVRGLGLPASAGESTEAFIRAISEQARGAANSEDSMETDL